MPPALVERLPPIVHVPSEGRTADRAIGAGCGFACLLPGDARFEGHRIGGGVDFGILDSLSDSTISLWSGV